MRYKGRLMISGKLLRSWMGMEEGEVVTSSVGQLDTDTIDILIESDKDTVHVTDGVIRLHETVIDGVMPPEVEVEPNGVDDLL